MAIAVAPAHETAHALLDRLLQETARARAISTGIAAEDLSAAEELADALDARARLIVELEACVRTMASTPGSITAATRASLVGIAKEIQTSNAALARGVQLERDIVAHTLDAMQRPDPVAFTYAARAGGEAHRLDLVR